MSNAILLFLNEERRLVFFNRIFLPILVWGILCFPFLSGRISIHMDTLNNYAFFKYFWNNVLNGTWPFWEPYMYFGHPFVAFFSCGVFNPLSGVIPLLVSTGVDYLQAYLSYLVVLFLIGAFGFRALAEEFYGEGLAASFAFWNFLFSGMIMLLFIQVNIILIFVPAVWLAVSLMRFLKAPTGAGCLQVIFWSMLLLVSYLPFYFICVAGIFTIVGSLIFGPPRVGEMLRPVRDFFWQNKQWLFLGAVSLAVAVTPMLLTKTMLRAGPYVSPGREGVMIGTGSVSKIGQELSGMSMEQAGRSSSLAMYVGPRSLVSHLGNYHSLRDDFFYFPSVIWLIILMAAFVRMDRKRACLLFSTLFIVLIAFGFFSSVYEALFKLVPLFRWFRNLFFLMGFIMPLMILFAAGQLQELLAEAAEPGQGLAVKVAGTVAGFGYFAILFFIDNVSWVTWVASAGIALVLIGALWNKVKLSSRAWKLVLFCFLMLEPFVVFSSFMGTCKDLSLPIPAGHSSPSMGLTRELYVDRPGASVGEQRAYTNWYADMAFDDRLFSNPYVDLISFPIAKYLDADLSAAKSALQYKFYYISHAAGKAGVPEADLRLSLAKPVDAVTKSLRITEATVNGLKVQTEFDAGVDLIYTDAFDKNWQARVDGRGVTIRPTVEGFKAVQVPPGTHILDLQFRPFKWPWIMWVLLGYFYVMGGACLWAGSGKRGYRGA